MSGGHRPFALISIEVTEPGSEHAAIQNPEMAAKWAEGWSVAYCWILVRQTDANSTAKSYLMVVMGPPRDGELPNAEREALAALVGAAHEGSATAIAELKSLRTLGIGLAVGALGAVITIVGSLWWLS